MSVLRLVSYDIVLTTFSFGHLSLLAYIFIFQKKDEISLFGFIFMLFCYFETTEEYGTFKQKWWKKQGSNNFFVFLMKLCCKVYKSQLETSVSGKGANETVEFDSSAIFCAVCLCNVVHLLMFHVRLFEQYETTRKLTVPELYGSKFVQMYYFFSFLQTWPQSLVVRESKCVCA